MSWIIHKFGGSSLADAGAFRTVADLLEARDDPTQVVVVSAMAGVTNALIELTGHAARGDEQWRSMLAGLEESHARTARELLDEQADETIRGQRRRFERLERLLAGLELLGTAPVEVVEHVSGLGEVWSAELLSTWLRTRHSEAVMLDAREVLRVTPTELHPAPDWSASAGQLAKFRARNPSTRYVVTGFICRDAGGRITNLGRNGSDYSASIFGALFEATEIHIWTDVDGVQSADPGRVPQALVLDHLSYREAFELAYFGARVLHPRTMAPAIEHGIPVFIRNTARPDGPGTRIDSDGGTHPPVKGITSIDHMALVNIEGAGMIGVPGTAERVFAALRGAGISVTMISQGSSEHSICCVLEEWHAKRAVQVLEAAFARETATGQIQRITRTNGITVLALVGDGMAGTPGISGRLFSSLGRASINVRAIAQGASERNISLAIDARDATRALRAVHAGFYLSEQTLSVGLIGPGQVGRALLAQIFEARARLAESTHLDLRVRAISNSRRMLLAEREIDLEHWGEALENSEQGTPPFASEGGLGGMPSASEEMKSTRFARIPPTPLKKGGAILPADAEAFADHIDADHLPHAVIIDCTASDAMADCYADWLKRGIHVLTANKHAGSGPLPRYRNILAAAGQARWRYEATVGAGLPVIQTLRDLRDTGDEILRVDGIFSGTLAYLFNRYDGSRPFSELVRAARDAGYTEPDPRDDLSGIDVARKLVTLAREAGIELELSDVKIESLVPNDLTGGSVNEFLAGLVNLDQAMAQRLKTASAENRVLRHCATLTADGRAEVALKSLPGDHPFASLALTDNIISFTTRRYRDNPLIVQGPGAGPEVTAAGVFADLLRVAASLGARL